MRDALDYHEVLKQASDADVKKALLAQAQRWQTTLGDDAPHIEDNADLVRAYLRAHNFEDLPTGSLPGDFVRVALTKINSGTTAAAA